VEEAAEIECYKAVSELISDFQTNIAGSYIHFPYMTGIVLEET